MADVNQSDKFRRKDLRNEFFHYLRTMARLGAGFDYNRVAIFSYGCFTNWCKFAGNEFASIYDVDIPFEPSASSGLSIAA